VLLRVARRTGALARLDLAVDETPVPSSPAQFRSLADGDLDAVLTSPDNVVAYRYSPANPLGTTLDARIVAAVDRGLGLALYIRPGLDPGDLSGARFGVDVPTSGFAFVLYSIAESLGLGREDYRLRTLGSTPQRLRALLAGECDATMLNAGSELRAELAGSRRLAGVGEVAHPYLGTVLAVVGGARTEPVTRLAAALSTTAAAICGGDLDDVVTQEAATALDLPAVAARRYTRRLKDPVEGLVADGVVDPAALRTVVELRRRHLPCVVDGVDLLAPALEPDPGLVGP
jgi:ABC-type nitrate/sulfonate/bicarbonate transport system substrate-binding protein